MPAARGPDPHTEVAHELLVRYLDAWIPMVLHGSRRVSYVEGYTGGSPPERSAAMAALRVFVEFTDLLERHQLTMVLVGPDEAGLRATEATLAQARSQLGAPDGLTVEVGVGAVGQALVPLLNSLGALAAPAFAYLDAHGAAAPPSATVAAIAGHRGSEVLVRLDSADALDCRAALARAGLDCACSVELVDTAGSAQALVFATASAKHLETFKNELWALDQYAGIRYRDPTDPERTLLDIAFAPQLGPLRRALLELLRDGTPRTLAQLRAFALAETVYRTADATRAVTALLHAHSLDREPLDGRLVPTTWIRLAAAQR